MTEQTTDTAGTGAGRTPEPKVSLGRIVHHRNEQGLVHAALVTKVTEDGAVSLTVFPEDASSHQAHSVSEVKADGTDSGWFWPPRV